MGGHPVPEIPCTICRLPVDLRIYLIADEHGQSVHDDCYMQRIINPSQAGSGRAA